MMKQLQGIIRGNWIMLLCFIVLLWCSSEAVAQITVAGKVTGSDGISKGGTEPLPGVNILIEGASTGTVTDLDGNYSLVVERGDETIVFSYIGYLSQKIKLNGRTTIDVVLVPDVKVLENIVIVGYGQQRKKEVTGAVASIKGDDLLKTATGDMASALQGKLAGVNVTASSGSPGAVSKVQIRGLGSISGDSTPLYVVDGIPVQGNPNIPSELIEEFTVLKDGAAASIYGTRASNGVILIKTKRGKKGTTKFNFSSYYGVQDITSGLPLLNTKDALFLDELGYNNKNGSSSVELQFHPKALERDTDWVDLLTNKNAPIQNHSFGINGGSEDLTYAVTTNYFQQQGVFGNADYERFSTRFNSTLSRGRFSAYIGLGLDIDDRQNAPWDFYQTSIRQKPYFTPFDPNDDEIRLDAPQNGNFLSQFARTLKTDNNNKNNGFWLNTSFKYKFTDWLNYELKVGANKGNGLQSIFEPAFLSYDENGDVINDGSVRSATLTERNTFTTRWTVENLLHLNKTFGDHNISGVIGISREQYKWKNSEAVKTTFLSNDIRVFNGASKASSIGGTVQEGAIAGSIGRLQYNYKDRYIISGVVRRDGSSNFGSSKRFKTFWGASFAYNISEENFFKNLNIQFIDNIKLRASSAAVGNQNIRRYAYANTISTNIDYAFGKEGSENLELGAFQGGFANPEVQWESNLTTNIGMDITLFKGKVEINTEVYSNNKQDMLIDVNLPPSSGAYSNDYFSQRRVVRNIGDMVNKGIEVSVSYRKKTGDLQWGLNYVFSKNINEVLDLGNQTGDFNLGGGRAYGQYAAQGENTTYIVKGSPAPSFFLIPTDGIVKTQEQLEDYRNLVSNAKLGDLIHVDTNGDGKIDDLDRTFQGSAIPDFEMGLTANFTYKNFDLSSQLFFSYGNKVFNGAKARAYESLRHQDLLYQWSIQNPESDIPTFEPFANGNPFNSRTWHDYWLEDGTFLRVKNIQIGYSIPKGIIEKIKIERVRIYISATNPFTFTKYTGFDPEVGANDIFYRGVDTGFYPVSRSFLLGANIDF